MMGTDSVPEFLPQRRINRADRHSRRTPGTPHQLDRGFIGDTKTTLRALLPKLDQNSYQQHLKDSVEHYRKTRKGLDELATANFNKGPIHPQYVVRVIDKLAAGDAVFTCDVGTAKRVFK